MFADPLSTVRDWTTITADGAETLVLPCLERAADHSLYGVGPIGSTLETQTLFIGHQYGKRNRYTARFTYSALHPDLLVDNNNVKFSQSCYVVFDSPNVGPVNPSAYSTIPLPYYMLKAIGGLLISVDTAAPLFVRVLNGET